MTDITERLRRIYVASGANYVEEAAREIERLRRSLEIIRIWARMDTESKTRGSLVPSHVIAVCDRALGKEEEK